MLGTEDMNELRENVKALLFAAHYDDGKTKSLIADSLWLNSDYGYNAETLESLAEIYRTSSYWGDPKDAEFVQALKDWLNDNTGGLLEDSVKKTSSGKPRTVLIPFNATHVGKVDVEAKTVQLMHLWILE